MKVRRLILEQDYPTIKTWWTCRGGTPPDPAILPDIGVIVEEAGVPISCLFLYTVSNASIAVAEWEATNPECTSPFKKTKALHMAFDFFEVMADKEGIRFIFSWVIPGRGDGRLLSARGWVKPQGEPHEMLAYDSRAKEALCH